MDKKNSLKKLEKIFTVSKSVGMKDDDEVAFYIQRDEPNNAVLLVVKSTGSLNLNEYLECLECFVDEMKHKDKGFLS